MDRCKYCGDDDCGKTIMCWRRFIREGLINKKKGERGESRNMSREREGELDLSPPALGGKFNERSKADEESNSDKI